MNRNEFYNYLINNFDYKVSTKPLQPDRYCKVNNKYQNLYESYELANLLLKQCKDLNLKRLPRYPSGVLVKNRLFEYIYGSYDFQIVKNSQNNVIRGFILTIVIKDTYFKFSFGGLRNKSDVSGIVCWNEFLKRCKENNINLDDYKNTEEEGIELKKQINKPLIKNFELNKYIDHANHLDLHAAYPSLVIEKHKEFLPVFTGLKKPIGDVAIGYMQSRFTKYKYANLSKEAVNGVNDKILSYHIDLEAKGFKVIGWNTDGIWYIDKTGKNRLYHNKDEGPGFGKWEHDYKDCRFYAVSDGQYFFYENGIFNVRLRGFYRKDTEKPREQWNEDDFFDAVNNNESIYYDEEEQQFKLRSKANEEIK